MLGLPDVPFTLGTLTTIAPHALAIALVGLMESLMTAKLVDDITDTHSNKTHNLAIGVVLGVLAAMVIFARRVAHFATVTGVLDLDGGTRTCHVHGELFFASSNDLVYQFDYANDPDHVIIDLTTAHISDASSVAALDAITTRYETRGKHVEIVGRHPASAEFHENLAGNLKVGH